MAHGPNKATNFEFPNMQSQWRGYVSSVDKTNIAPNIYVKGSKNMYKKLSGTIANRPGQKRLGVANTTVSPISSSFVWNTSWGATYTMVISNSNLYVVVANVWYSLLTGLTATRYVFDKWYSAAEAKDRLLFVNGSDDIQHWSGGFASLASATTNEGLYLIGNNPLLTAPVTAAGTSTFTIDTNGLSSTAFGEVLSFPANPTNGQTLVLTVNGTAISFQFVTVIGAVAGNVLIAGTLAGTIANLIGLITNPATTNANQVALSAPNQVLIAYLTATQGTNTLTKSGTASWQNSGFSTTTGEKQITINGNAYTYTGGERTTTLIGVTPSAAAEPVGSTVLQTVLTTQNTPSPGFANDFLKVINNQVYVGSYTSRLCFISQNTNFANYTVPTPRLAGDPELLTLDGTLKGIGVRQGNACIGVGSSFWAVITFVQSTAAAAVTGEQQTNVDMKPVAILQAPKAHEFIANVGDNLVYLAQDNQLRSFGDFNNLFVPGYPSFSQEVATELAEENFLGGALSCIGEFTYITAPVTGNVWLYQVRQSVDANGMVVAERMWHSPFVWNVTNVLDQNGTVVGFSNANPQIYQLWDTAQWHDDSPSDQPLPYACQLNLSYRPAPRAGLQSFDKLFTEGYITPDTTLTSVINYDYQGATNSFLVPINLPPNRLTYLFTPNSVTAHVLGDEPLGDNILGNDYTLLTSDQDTLPKFKNINSVSQVDCFEYQPTYASDEADARWEILAVATNAEVSKENLATYIINKM